MKSAHCGLRGSEEWMWSTAILGIITLIPLARTFLEGTGSQLGMENLHESLRGLAGFPITILGLI